MATVNPKRTLPAPDGFGAGWRSDLRAFGQSEGVFDVHT